MKLLYAHDHIFYLYDNKYYSNGSFPKEVLERYTDVFDEMRFISRQKNINESTNNLTLASLDNVEFIGVPNFKSIKSFHLIKRAKNIIYKEVLNSDCVIARLPSSIGNMAIKYAKQLNKPYLVEVVGCAWDSLWNYGGIKGKILAPIEYNNAKRNIKLSRYTSYITKEFLQSRYPTNGKSEVLPNVNIPIVDNKVLDRRLLNIDRLESKQEVIFGLIGSLDVDYKGHETVIKALSIIKEKIPNFRVEFLGKGSKERWEELSKKYGVYENIKFIGTLPSGDAVYNWMDSIDISLQPSLAEAQGRSIIEAMSRGCPVIASRVGGIVELIDNEWLIDAGDYKQLASKLEILIQDKYELREQATRNFNEAKLYNKNEIDINRKEFLKEFKMYVENYYNQVHF